jgi:hypothetical protein
LADATELRQRMDYSALARLPASAIKFTPGFEDVNWNTPSGGAERVWVEDAYQLAPFEGALSGFQSKFNEAIRNQDGTVTATLQQPGRNKYDLVRATYRQDPTSGEWVLQGQPQEFRQGSSLSRDLKSLAQGAAFVGTAALGMNALGGALTGASGAAGSGAAAGGGAGNLATPITRLGAPLSTGGLAMATPTAASMGLGSLPALAPMAGSAAAGFGSGLGGLIDKGAAVFGDFKPGDWINLGGLVSNIVTRPKAPDTSGINAAAQSNADIARRTMDLTERQYADQLAMFNEFKPMLLQQIQQSIASQAKSDQRSDAQWADYESIWRPQERRLSEMTLAMSDPARFKADANRAGDRVAGEFDRARSESRRSLEMAGASPDKIAALEAAGRLVEAKGVAGAQDQAFRESEGRAMSYLDNAARFGRNMPSTGIATAQLAGQQGGQAVGGVNNLSAAAAQPAQSAFQGYQNVIGANNASARLFNQAAILGLTGDIASNNATLGAFAGLNRWFGSSEKTKKMGPTLADAGAKVAASPAKHWAYKPGEGDGNTQPRMGPTAESLASAAPEVSDGQRVDAIAMLGLHHGAIGEHEGRLKRIERALSLADAA